MTLEKAADPEPSVDEAPKPRDAEDLVLVQHHPAWGVQAYLRFAAIPHRVRNTCFSELGDEDFDFVGGVVWDGDIF